MTPFDERKKLLQYAMEVSSFRGKSSLLAQGQFWRDPNYSGALIDAEVVKKKKSLPSLPKRILYPIVSTAPKNPQGHHSMKTAPQIQIGNIEEWRQRFKVPTAQLRLALHVHVLTYVNPRQDDDHIEYTFGVTDVRSRCTWVITKSFREIGYLKSVCLIDI
jgi:hypothetical protein